MRLASTKSTIFKVEEELSTDLGESLLSELSQRAGDIRVNDWANPPLVPSRNQTLKPVSKF